jgi:hypothetical protein
MFVIGVCACARACLSVSRLRLCAQAPLLHVCVSHTAINPRPRPRRRRPAPGAARAPCHVRWPASASTHATHARCMTGTRTRGRTCPPRSTACAAAGRASQTATWASLPDTTRPWMCTRCVPRRERLSCVALGAAMFSWVVCGQGVSGEQTRHGWTADASTAASWRVRCSLNLRNKHARARAQVDGMKAIKVFDPSTYSLSTRANLTAKRWCAATRVNTHTHTRNP